MLVVDGHLDLAMNALYLDRNLRLSAHELRTVEDDGPRHWGRGRGTVGLPDLRAGRVCLAFGTVIARVRARGNPFPDPFIDFATYDIAYAHAQGQLAHYHELQRQGILRLIDDWPSLRDHLEAWRHNPAAEPLGIVVSMEGADPIVEPGQLAAWRAGGVRIVGLAHYGPSAYAHGTQSVGGLTAWGWELLGAMEQQSVILDVTHLSDDSFWEAIERFRGPLLASHSNCRALVPGDRQLSDEMLKELFRRDAVIGAALDAWMLQPGWEIGTTTPEGVTLETYADHIDYVCQLAGNSRHAAIGTDLDGGYGTEQTPRDLDTIADLQRIPEILRRRGYADADVEAIMHGNWVRLLRRAWTGDDGTGDYPD